jgi:hypothetical protein
MKSAALEARDSAVFLAMFWAGGGPFALSDLIAVYDWMNHSILNAKEMESTLNRLLMAGLIQNEERGLLIPPPVYRAFDRFRKRRRKNRFEMALAFLETHESPGRVVRRVRLAEAVYRRALGEYHQKFDVAMKKASGRSH